MKGFRPTGYGPSAGFKFPASYGFTGSTGAYTNVSPYVRMKPRAFKDGGYVSKTVGDPGHALVQRDRPYTNEDQQSGGRSPLRRGFKKGGKLKKADGGAVRQDAVTDLRRKTKMLAATRDFYRESGQPQKSADFQRALNEQKGSPVLDEGWRHRAYGAKRKGPLSQATSIKGKFAAADGGRVVRGSSAKSFGKSLADLPALVKEVVRMGPDAIQRSRRDVTDTKRRFMDRDLSRMETGYSRGGKMKRMGYADGGSVQGFDRLARAPHGSGRYAKGGAVSRGEAKKIAERTVGEHVKYPAPKGHKGLGAMCK